MISILARRGGGWVVIGSERMYIQGCVVVPDKLGFRLSVEIESVEQ